MNDRTKQLHTALSSLYQTGFVLPPATEGQDLKLDLPSDPTNVANTIKNKPKLLGRVLTYEFKGGTDKLGRRVNFAPPPYDLAEIGRAADVEPYIAQSIRKHREQILKEGYTITGTDAKMVDYIKKRLFEMTYATGISTQEWLRSFTTNLITYHNSYLIFRRDEDRSRGKNIRLHGKDLEPIAGIFIPDPTTMTVSVDRYGTPKKWRQAIDSGTLEKNQPRNFDVSDVLACTMDKKAGYSYGTPYILPVLDDVRALRRLEELSMIVASKEAFPLYHYKVGTEDNPAIIYEGGGDEVGEVSSQIAAMPLQGNIVTTERHEIKLISRDGAAMDLAPYLEYFEKRVMGGLRLSPLDLGRGSSANKGTATNINKGLQDAAKDYQEVVANCITYFLFTPLLLEGGFDVLHDNIVQLSFNTIDTEEKRANENHGSQLCLNSQITCDEFRRDYLDKPPIPKEEIGNTTREMDAEVEEKMVRVAAAVAPKPAASSSSSSAKKTTSTNKKTVANKSRPANQSGSKPKRKVKANDFERSIDAQTTELRSAILAIKNDGADGSEAEVKKIFYDFVTDSVEVSKPFIDAAISDGLDDAAEEFGTQHPTTELPEYELGNRSLDRFYYNFITKSYWKVVNPYMDSIYRCFSADTDNNREPFRAIGAIEAFRKAIKRLLADQVETARAFGFAKFAKEVGYNMIALSESEKGERKEVDIAQIRYTDLIPDLGSSRRDLSFVSNGNPRK